MEIRCKHEYTKGDIILDLSYPYRLSVCNFNIDMTKITGRMKLTHPAFSHHRKYINDITFVSPLNLQEITNLIKQAKFNKQFEDKLND